MFSGLFVVPVSFQLLPGVKVVIANPETKGQCADSHLGEVSETLSPQIVTQITCKTPFNLDI